MFISILLTVITFLVVLSILVLIHEGGHFLMAKRAGIKVDEFGLGYPPRLWSKKIGETIYSINLLPLGGFVRLRGEEYTTEELKSLNKSPGAFYAKSKLARTGVIVAGVIANFLLAIVCFSTYYSITGIPMSKQTEKVIVLAVTPGTPAANAGIKEGQVIEAIDGKLITTTDELINTTKEMKGKEITLMVDGQDLLVTPRSDVPDGEGPLGVAITNEEIIMKKYPIYKMIPLGINEGFKEAIGWGRLILGSLGKMVSDMLTLGKAPKDVAGPIGIVQVTSSVVKLGILPTIQFMGILSVNLAVMNVLPFPALDGGRLAFIIYEAIARRKPKPEFERWINAAGMTALLILIGLVTIGDIRRIITTTTIIEKIRGVLPF